MYAHREEFPQHEAALAEVTRLAEGPRRWALPVFVLGEFLRVVTHPRVLHPPTGERTAVAAVQALLDSTSLRVLNPGHDHWAILGRLVVDEHVRGNLVYDAQIAAVCIEHGATTVLTEDRDFSRFEDLVVRRLAKT